MVDLDDQGRAWSNSPFIRCSRMPFPSSLIKLCTVNKTICTNAINYGICFFVGFFSLIVERIHVWIKDLMKYEKPECAGVFTRMMCARH